MSAARLVTSLVTSLLSFSKMHASCMMCVYGFSILGCVCFSVWVIAGSTGCGAARLQPPATAREVNFRFQPPFLGPAAPGPEVGGGLLELRVSFGAPPERAKALDDPIVALAFRSSIFLRSISSYISVNTMREIPWNKDDDVPPCVPGQGQLCHLPPVVGSRPRGREAQSQPRPPR